MFKRKKNQPIFQKISFEEIFKTYFNYSIGLNDYLFNSELYKYGYERIKLLMEKPDSQNYCCYSFFIDILFLNISIYKDYSKIKDILQYFDIKLFKETKFTSDNEKRIKQLYDNNQIISGKISSEVNLKFEIFLIMGQMAINNIDNTINLLQSLNSNKEIIANSICECFSIFSEKIFNKKLLDCFMKFISKTEVNLNKIVAQTICFKDYIDIVNENINFYKNITFKISTNNFLKEDFGDPKETNTKIINILSECNKSFLDSESILEKCPNFCDYLSQEEKFKMYHLIKKKDDKIKRKLGESIMHDAESNKEIIDTINKFIFWEFPEYYPNVIDLFKKLNFQTMDSELLNNFIITFKNFNFFDNYNSNPEKKKLEIKVFFTIMEKIERIIDFSNIFWRLFRYDINYNFPIIENFRLVNKFFTIFAKSEQNDINNNLFDIIKETFVWFSLNIESQNFYIELEKYYIGKTPEEELIVKTNISNTYVKLMSFFINYNLLKNDQEEHLIHYIIESIELLNNENLSIILNEENISSKLRNHLNQFILKKSDFFIENSRNKIISIENNNDFKQSKYYHDSMETVNNLKKDIEKLKLTFDELQKLSKLSEQNLNEKINILSIEKSDQENFINNIKTKINEFITKKFHCM